MTEGSEERSKTMWLITCSVFNRLLLHGTVVLFSMNLFGDFGCATSCGWLRMPENAWLPQLEQVGTMLDMFCFDLPK